MIRKILACVGLFVAAVILRLAIESRAAWNAGVAHEAQGKVQEALLDYDRSAHAYFPLNPYVGRSLSALWSLGQRLEATDVNLALWAYDSIRGSVFGTASVYVPHREWLPKVDERIAVLRATVQAKAGNSGGLSNEALLSFHRNRLAKSPAHLGPWSVIVTLSFLAWLGSVAGLIFWGHDADGRMHFRRALPWILLMSASFTLWIVGLTRA